MEKVTKEYLSSREAASALGVAVSTIQLWTNNGLLSAWTTAGGHRRILASSVAEMLLQQQQQQQQQSGRAEVNALLKIILVEDNEQQLRMYQKTNR